jgi:hypothetical protein
VRIAPSAQRSVSVAGFPPPALGARLQRADNRACLSAVSSRRGGRDRGGRLPPCPFNLASLKSSSFAPVWQHHVPGLEVAGSRPDDGRPSASAIQRQ